MIKTLNEQLAASRKRAKGSQKRLEYYDTNVNGSIRLAEAMAKAGVKKLVFSSSAT